MPRWTIDEARRRLLECLLPRRFETVRETIEHLGHVQEDSIDVCGRMHDLILRNRVQNYRPRLLEDALYGPNGCLFEDYLPNLAAAHRSHLRHFAWRMANRRLQNGGEHLAPEETRILERIRELGPRRARDLDEDPRRTESGWGTRRSMAAETLERLWRHGRLAIAGRHRFERIFDLPERVYGTDARWLADVSNADLATEAEHCIAGLTLRSRPLIRPTRVNLPDLRQHGYTPIEIQTDPKEWWASPQFLNPSVAPNPKIDETLLLAPLDPIIYQRPLTHLLFGFDYRWEVYTPSAKRMRGYYVLPILQRQAIVGWVDLRRNREGNRLDVVAGRLMAGADRAGVDTALQQFAVECGYEYLPDRDDIQTGDL